MQTKDRTRDYSSCHPCLFALLIPTTRTSRVVQRVSHVRVKSSADCVHYAPIEAAIDAVHLWILRRIEIQKEMATYCSRSITGPSLEQKQCPMCSFKCPSIAILLSHLRLVHSNDPRFLVCCGINSCTKTSRSFSSLYTHVYRHHPSAGIRRRSTNSLSMELPTACESSSHEGIFQCGTGT